MQPRWQSATEALVNVALGYAVGIAAQAAILPQFGCHAALADHLAIASAFTAVSLVRSYVLRRMFNRWRAA